MLQIIKRRPLLFAVLFTLAIVLRVYYLYTLSPVAKYFFSDMKNYSDNAFALARGLPTTQIFSKPPFYEWFLVFAVKLSDWKVFKYPATFVQHFQFILSLLLPCLLALSSKKWLGKKAAVYVLIASLFYFPFIEYAGLYMAELPFAFVLSILILLTLKSAYPWAPKNAAIIGGVWAFSLFIKGQAVFFPFLAFLYSLLWIYSKDKSNLRKKILPMTKSWAFFSIGVLVVFAFQAGVKKWVFRAPNSVPAVAALNFASVRCESCRRFVDSNGVWACSSKFHQVGGCTPECKFPAPFEDSGFYWQQGFSCLKEKPLNVFSSLSEISSLFVGNEAFPFMEIPELRILNRNWEFLFQLFILPAIIFGCFWRFRLRGSLRVGLVHCLAWNIFLMAYLFAGEVRYRIPFDTVFLPLAVGTWLKISGKLNLKAF